MVWGGGLLAKWGVLDFAGGIVVHNIAGIAALASVLYVGRRKVADTGPAQHPAGRPGHRPAVVRLVRLQRRQRVPGGLGHRRRLPQHRRRRLVRGGHLAGRGVDDARSAEVPRPAHRRRGRPGHDHARGGLRLAAGGRAHRHRRRASSATTRWRSRTSCGWDDALDVWGVHGVGGFIGVVLLGIFATTAFNPPARTGCSPATPTFLVKELVAVSLSSVWAFVFTYGMLWLIDRITPVRVSRRRGGGGPRLRAPPRGGVRRAGLTAPAAPRPPSGASVGRRSSGRRQPELHRRHEGVHGGAEVGR